MQNELSQAERILKKFGGAPRLAGLFKTLGIGRNLHGIYKWTYPSERGGTGGVIPHLALRDVLEAARFDGIYLSPEDLDPRPAEIKYVAGPHGAPHVPKAEHAAWLLARDAREKVIKRRQLRKERLAKSSSRKYRSRAKPAPSHSSQKSKIPSLDKLAADPRSQIEKNFARKTHAAIIADNREMQQAWRERRRIERERLKLEEAKKLAQFVRSNPTVGVPPPNPTGPPAVQDAAPIPPPPLTDQQTLPEAILKAETPLPPKPRKTRSVGRYRALLAKYGRIK